MLKGPVSISNDGSIVGNGGVVVDLNKTTFNTAGKTLDITNLIFRNGSGAVGGAIIASGSDTYSNCVFSANSANSGGAMHIPGGLPHIISGCTFTSNTATIGAAIYTYNAGSGIDIRDCVFDNEQTVTLRANTTIKVGGTIKTNAQFVKYYDANSYILVSSGTILDFTGCSNTLPFNPGSGVIINGGMTVKYQHDSANNLLPNSSSYSITGATFTVPSLRNDNVVNLGGTNIVIRGGSTTNASNCTFNNGSTTTEGGAVNISGRSGVFENCVFSGNVASNGTSSTTGGAMCIRDAPLTLSNCVFKNNFAYGYAGAVRCHNATTAIVGCVISGNSGDGAGRGIMATGGATTLSNTVVTSNVSRDGVFGNDVAQVYQSRGILNINGGCTLGYISVNGLSNGDSATPDGSMCFSGSNFVSSAWVNSTGIVIISGGAIMTLGTSIRAAAAGHVTVQTGGCTVNGHVIPAGNYTTINSDGTTT